MTYKRMHIGLGDWLTLSIFSKSVFYFEYILIEIICEFSLIALQFVLPIHIAETLPPLYTKSSDLTTMIASLNLPSPRPPAFPLRSEKSSDSLSS